MPAYFKTLKVFDVKWSLEALQGTSHIRQTLKELQFGSIVWNRKALTIVKSRPRSYNWYYIGRYRGSNPFL